MLGNHVRKNLFIFFKILNFKKFITWKGKVMEFIPYCAEEEFQFCFYQIPKELFTNEYYKGKLSSSTILLYGLLLDRLSVSIKNKWIDENGVIYLILTRKEAMEKSTVKIPYWVSEILRLRYRKNYDIVRIIIVKIKRVRKKNWNLNKEIIVDLILIHYMQIMML